MNAAPKPTVKFSLGRIVATPGALEALAKSRQDPGYFLGRHVRGDWGEVCEDDGQLNDESLKDGSRILSAYKTLKGDRLWIITEAKNDEGIRYSTTLSATKTREAKTTKARRHTAATIEALLRRNPRAVERAIVRLDWLGTFSTDEVNGPRGKYMAAWLWSGKHLTGWWVEKGREVALAYSRLLARVANEEKGGRS